MKLQLPSLRNWTSRNMDNHEDGFLQILTIRFCILSNIGPEVVLFFSNFL